MKRLIALQQEIIILRVYLFKDDFVLKGYGVYCIFQMETFFFPTKELSGSQLTK